MPDRVSYMKITCCQRTVSSNIEGFFILLKRLPCPCRFTDMVPIFERNSTEICLILDFIHSQHSHRMSIWNQSIFSPGQLLTYAIIVHGEGEPLTNCFDFIDGTVIPISRPSSNQQILFNGHKRIQVIKFQNIALLNGFIGNFSRSYGGKRHDSTML